MKRTFFAILACLLLAAASGAQQPSTPAAATATYRIQIVLHDQKPGQTEKVRTFSFTQHPGSIGTLQDGDKVPIASDKDGHFTYVPVGIDLTCSLPESRDIPADALPMMLRVQISSVVASSGGAIAVHPVMRSADVTVNTTVPLGKTTTVANFSNMAGDESYQIEVLAVALP